MKPKLGSFHDLTPPPATMQRAPVDKSRRYSQGHARNGNGVGHRDALTVDAGPSPVIMSKSPARKNQRPAVLTRGCSVSWEQIEVVCARIILTR
jgi:hypothetical protein